MKSVIDEILFGNWGRTDSVKPSAEGRAQADRVAELGNRLTELLQDFSEAREAFEAYLEETETQCMLEVRDFYRAGFRNAFLLAADIFCGEE